MAYRYAAKNTAIALAGTEFTHGLGATPDEWFIVNRGAPTAGSPPAYIVAVGSTSITVAASSGATTCDVFCAVNHSIIG